LSQLSIDLFLGAARDTEAARYRLLSALKGVRGEFSRNRIYPTLSTLIDLYDMLRKIAEGGRALRDELPRRIVGIDLENNRILSEPVDLPSSEIEAIRAMIEWALPEFVRAIEEGRTIYHFVDESLRVEEVGIIPSYVEEGYILLPEAARGLLHVLRYEVSIFASADERYRNLKTSLVTSYPIGRLAQTPSSLKQELIEVYHDLPNPATYYFETDIDFPFQETLLPVAKRKLLRQIYS